MDLFYFIEVVLVFVLGWSMSAVVLPRISLFAFRRRLFDQMNSRKIHTDPIPRLGGIAFFPCILVVMSLVLVYNNLYGGKNMLDIDLTICLLSLFVCLFALYLMGMMDDLVGVCYHSKFIIQILCGILLVASGFCFDSFYGLFGVYELPFWIGIPFTVFIIMFILNAINLIDGIDGLASGLSIIAFLVFGYMFARIGWWVYALLAFAILGVLIPFFYYNVFGKVRNGRKIFMGDTGSLTIGLLLVVMVIRLSMMDITKDTIFPDAIVIAFSFLMVPVLDAVRVVIHRLREGKNLFVSDKNHIHHKLMALGLRQHQALVCIMGIAIVFIIVNVLSIHYVSITTLFLTDIVIWTVMHIWITMKINNRLDKK